MRQAAGLAGSPGFIRGVVVACVVSDQSGIWAAVSVNEMCGARTVGLHDRDRHSTKC